MRRTYVDASVLIAAFRGTGRVSERALQVLDDPERRLVVSDCLRLEVLPKPTVHGRQEELQSMQRVFDAAEDCKTCPELTEFALNMASRYDMSPMDALHLGAAKIAAVDELVTLEKPTKPMCRVEEVRVVSLSSESEAAR